MAQVSLSLPGARRSPDSPAVRPRGASDAAVNAASFESKIQDCTLSETAIDYRECKVATSSLTGVQHSYAALGIQKNKGCGVCHSPLPARKG